MIKGRDTSFELCKFSVVSETGERREQLGLAGVQVGEVVMIEGTEFIVESLPVADKFGVLGVKASRVK